MNRLSLAPFRLFIALVSFIIVAGAVIFSPALVKADDNSSTAASSCQDVPPENSPDLLQVDTKDQDATLDFVPVKDHVSSYLISYGYTQDDPGFLVSFVPDNPNWVISHKIELLKPGTTYYFKVSALNGCSSGPWSNVLKTQTADSGSQTTITAYKGVISVVNGVLQINSKSKSLVNIPLPFDDNPQPNSVTNQKSKNWLVDTIAQIEKSLSL